MTFLNPLVLFGLLAAAIPLIIHLFNFRKPRRVDFSSLAFLKELQRSTMRRVRIKQWLLLALRMLAIAALVLAFARPTLEGPLADTLGRRATSSVALVLDNSTSMTLRDTQGEYFRQARDMAAGVIDQLEQGDEVLVFPTAPVTDGPPDAYRNRGPALDALDVLQTEIGSRPLGRTLAQAVLYLDRALHVNKEIYLISDLQRTTFLDSIRFEVPEDIRLYLLPVGDRTHTNVAVTDVQILSRIVEAGQPVQLEAELTNFGTEPLDNYIVSVFLEGDRVAQNVVTLAPGAQTTVLLTITPQRRGWLAGEVRTEADAFDVDNTRHFTLNVPDRRRILIVRGQGQSTRYLELALSSRLTQGRIAFDVQILPESALSATALADVDALILAGVSRLSSGDLTKITGYVQEGGGLLVFPNAEGVNPDLNALLNTIGGGRLTGTSGTLNSGRPIAGFDRVDTEHPLFGGVFDPADEAATGETRNVESPDVYYAVNYAPEAGDEQNLIELSNGQPFLQEIRHGDGTVLVCTVAPDLTWSDLPVRGFFIPLMYRSMFYLASSHESVNEGLLVGASNTLRVSGTLDGEVLALVGPDRVELTPEQRTLFGGVSMQIPATLRTPGIYDVRAGDRTVRRVAFNIDSRESDLGSLALAEARERLETATGHEVRTIDARGDEALVATAINEQRYGVELWNVFLLLALVFLVAEMLVAMQWRPEPVAA